MMQSHSAAFDAAINGKYRQLALRATLKTETKTYQLGAEDFEGGSLSITFQCMAKGFELGTAMAADLSFALNNRNHQWNNVQLEGATIEPYCGVHLPDKTIEYIPMGVFIIDEPGRPYAILQAKATDRMILLDKDFSGVELVFPATLKEILEAVSTYCLLPLSGEVLTAGQLLHTVEKRPEGDLSCRDIVGEIALYGGSFARCNRNGELEFVTIPKDNTDAIIFDVGSRFSFEQISDLIQITGVRIGETLYGTNSYVLELDDLVLQPTEEMLADLANKIIGYSYTACKADYPGNPAIDCGDWIKHITRDGRTINAILTKHTYKHGGKCQVLSEGKSKPAQNYRAANSRRMASLVAEAKAAAEATLSDYELSSAQLNERLSMILGAYPSEETLEDGSKIYYYHDKPTREESETIWKFTGNALAVSDDGGKTWETGLTSDSNLIVKQIKTYTIKTRWLTTDMIAIGGGSLTEHITAADELLEQHSDEIPRMRMEAEEAANAYAQAQIEAEKIRSEAYADNVLTLAEQDALAKAENAEQAAKQYADEREAAINAFTEQIVSQATADVRTFIRTDADGNLLIGKAGNPIVLRQTNDRISFLSNGQEVAYFSNNKLYVTEAEVLNRLIIGGYQWRVLGDKSIVLEWVG